MLRGRNFAVGVILLICHHNLRSVSLRRSDVGPGPDLPVIAEGTSN